MTSSQTRPAQPDEGSDTLNSRIRRVRAQYKMTQEDFAKEVGVSRSYLSEVESGKSKPSIEILVGIATYCQSIAPLWLLTGHGPMLVDIYDETGNTRPNSWAHEVDKNALSVVIEIIEKALADLDTRVEPHEKAGIVISLYSLYVAVFDAHREGKKYTTEEARLLARAECQKAIHDRGRWPVFAKLWGNNERQQKRDR